MVYGVFAIYDAAAGIYTSPTIDVTDVSATRNFAQAVNNPGSAMNFKPDDFSLYRLGFYNVETGMLDAVVPPVKIVSGDKCMKVVIENEV